MATTETSIEKISKVMTKFFSSWWAVLAHTILVIIWFVFRFSLELFMFWISLEAIFIWVVYLAASGRREEKRDKVEAFQQAKIKEKMLDNLANGDKADEKLDRITKMLYELQEEVKRLKKN